MTVIRAFETPAGILGMSLLAFVVVSVPARLVRFALVTDATHVFGRLTRRFPKRYVVAVLGARLRGVFRGDARLGSKMLERGRWVVDYLLTI